MDSTLTPLDTPPATIAETVHAQMLVNRVARHEREWPHVLVQLEEAIQVATTEGRLFALVEHAFDGEVVERIREHFEAQGFKVTAVSGDAWPNLGAYVRVNL